MGALEQVRHFDFFPTAGELQALAERLSSDERFDVRVVGESVAGRPIHHVRFGTGSLKVLLVAGPQAMEPIGGLTVVALLDLLERDHPSLVAADVEWNVVPCIDPDAAVLNEGWYTKPFTLENYMRNFWMQPRPEQVDFSFPISYKGFDFNRPSTEAKVLMGVLDEVMPDFYFSLHNYGPGFSGCWFGFAHAMNSDVYDQLYALATSAGMSFQDVSFLPDSSDFPPGMAFMGSARSVYDWLEREGVPLPKEIADGRLGSPSSDYLLAQKPDAQAFVSELPYGRLPREGSDAETGKPFRQEVLRLDADNKFLATVILEEWENVHEDLDQASPFYRKILAELVEPKDSLPDGVTEWYTRPIHQLLFGAQYGGTATYRQLIHAYAIGRWIFLCMAYTFVRLLKDSPQTERVRHAIERLDQVFSHAVADMNEAIQFDEFESFSCDTLARTQLGSGLIVLNSLLASRAR